MSASPPTSCKDLTDWANVALAVDKGILGNRQIPHAYISHIGQCLHDVPAKQRASQTGHHGRRRSRVHSVDSIVLHCTLQY